jgi:hypothetical protein
VRRWSLTFTLLAVGCSLLAPNDAYYTGNQGGGGAAEGLCAPAPPCAELSPPDIVVTTADVAALAGVVADAAPGTTIGLEPGTYVLSSTLEVRADGVTLRSTTGNAADVVINAALPSVVSITSSEVTLAQLTLTASGESAVLLNPPPQGSERVRLCGVTIQDAGESFVRTAANAGYADCVLVEGSTLRLTDAGRQQACCTNCVPAAMRVDGGRGWVVRGNTFSGFYCSAVPPVTPADCFSAPFSLLFVQGARDTLIEQNRIEDCVRGIGLGFTVTSTAPRAYADAPYGGDSIDHYDGIVRNNVIAGHPICFDTGIEINRAREPHILHNTVVHLGTISYGAIDRRFPTTFARIHNNLVRGGIRARDCGAMDCTDLLGVLSNNLEVDALETFFVAAAPFDPHLLSTSPAVDAGVTIEEAGLDLDGQTRDAGAAPDVGADEYQP